MTDGIKHDFFVSFTEVDLDKATWVAQTLETAGYRCLFQHKDFVGGQDINDRMIESSEDSERTISIWSDAYFASESAYSETVTRYGDDKLGRKRGLLWVAFDRDFRVPKMALRSKIGLLLYRTTDWAARAQALLRYVDSAITGIDFGHTDFTLPTGDAVIAFDGSVGPRATWIPPVWNAAGPDPMPLTDQRDVRLDVLWARDTTPFRAVVADWPGGDLAATLRGEADMPIRSRAWHDLPELFGRDRPYANRSDVVGALNPSDGSTLNGPLGVIAGFSGADGVVQVATAVDRVTRAMEALHRLLPDDAIVLRVESDLPEWSIRVAAGAGRELHKRIGPVDVVTRIRTTDDAAPPMGGAIDNPIGLLMNAIRAHRLALGGVAAPWDATPGAVGGVGVDTAFALVRELNASAPNELPVAEALLLKHIRDCLPGVWPAVLQAHAGERGIHGWYIGLSVAAEWRTDLAIWTSAADEHHQRLIQNPLLAMGRCDTDAIDALVLAESTPSEVAARWAPYASDAVQAYLAGKRLPGMEIDTAHRLAHYVPAAQCDDPASPLFWMRLGTDPDFDPSLVRRAGYDPLHIVGSRYPLPTDPTLRQRLGYYRALIRPHGSSV